VADAVEKRHGRERVIIAGSVVAVAVAVVFAIASRGGDEASVLPTPSPTASAAPRVEGVAGDWGSTFGPVTLVHDELGGDEPVTVTGTWQQGPDKTGEITSGTFNPAKGTLKIKYTELWSGVKGNASFTLSEDGDTLDGSYEQQDVRGAWVLSR
jgi:hypothetical protein